MSKICDVCGKKPSFGNQVSHSNRKSARRWNVNIQSVKATQNGTVRSMNVCTKCIKANKVVRAVQPVTRPS